MAMMLDKKAKNADALPLHKKALEIRLEIYGKKHAEVGLSYNNLGVCFQNLQKNDEAMESYKLAYEIWKECYGD
eukprot:CAMPEP_0114582316 /NCGR_PEP_ID=MMETSP0125-20121206/6334_1 /TAXON_ID=485358 ORGANISM="Aristerostoma sp., Strain ATCC 50986" /NCGR_SAMPLE_ID=MMETSP0125 /ASSEMBLY_ACC=CAM_ASM_000245 /LENGTH=73 /DNA_ID=CAMNT_0001775221 /DNA_START=817 /DNA_END=1035 /DNA_ORIENTATION=+